MDVEVVDADALAGRVAEVIADELRSAVAARGVATLAVSGGGTPTPMFRVLATLDVPWPRVHVLQVDERVAPDGHPDRNLGPLREALTDRVPVPADQVHAMPVEGDEPLETLAERYATTLREVAGDPPTIDVVQLGLGDDGHTASLLPGDPTADASDREVVATGPYEGRRRLTLTAPVLDRARRIVWMVEGAGKAEATARLWRRDPTIPATVVARDRAVLLVDESAAADLPAGRG